MTRMHRPASQQGCMTLTLATLGTSEPAYHDKPSVSQPLQPQPCCG